MDEREGSNSLSGRANPAISQYLMFATYLLGGAGIALGIYGAASKDAVKGLHYALPLMAGAVGLVSFVRHSVFHASDAARAGVDSDPFFMIELGIANGAIGVLALFAFFGGWGVAAEAALMLTYGLYLGCALGLFLARRIPKGMDGGMVFGAFMWAVQVGVMVYLGIAAAVTANLKPF